MSTRLKPRAAGRPDSGPCPTIATPRLVLRPVGLADAEAIAASLADWQVSRMLSRVPMPYHRQDALDWLNGLPGLAQPSWPLAITEGDGVMIGLVSLELRHGRWHIGYWLNRYYWGRGLMSEAAGAAIERFFRRQPEAVLASGAFADNPASLVIQAKLGFRTVACAPLFSEARNAMAPHIETSLTQAEFRRPAVGTA